MFDNCLKRLRREFQSVGNKWPAEWHAELVDEDYAKWKVKVVGPQGSAYEGGHFWMEIDCPPKYPFNPPHVRFTTPIYHCNIASDGTVSHDIWSSSWSPGRSLLSVVTSIVEFLDQPNPDHPMNSTIAREYISNREEHDNTAREWTCRYAEPENWLVLTTSMVVDAPLEVVRVTCTDISGKSKADFELGFQQLYDMKVSDLYAVIYEQLELRGTAMKLILPDGSILERFKPLKEYVGKQDE